MKRRAVLLSLIFLVSSLGLGPTPAAAAPAGSITWTVDHHKKTITALLRIQIYSGCSGNPFGNATDQAGACSTSTSQVTQFLADKISQQVDRIWNKGYHFRCYRLIVRVDVKLAADRGAVDADRLGVRIDPSPVRVRSWVDAATNTAKWDSENPADRVDPQNGSNLETTWSEGAQGRFAETYAHEVGHMLGLDDTYTWSRDANGQVTSKSVPGAPLDLMNGGEGIDQRTIDLLIKRNSDRLGDKDGNSVDLNELRCEASFLVDFDSKQDEYSASNVMDSIVDPPCSRAPFTSSSTQRLHATAPGPVEVTLVEDPSLPQGYVLVPAFDAMTLQNGMTGGGRAAGATGLFDVPIAVTVFRAHDEPASGDIPVVLDLPSKGCPGGDSGNPPPRPDCGNRTYNAWIAMSQKGADLWPEHSSLPSTLQALGYSEPRLDKLYKRCPGPTPWPGAFTESSDARKEPGRMPSLAALKQLYDDWSASGKAGNIEINGKATTDVSQAGSYELDEFDWFLTLCPINADGEASAGCVR